MELPCAAPINPDPRWHQRREVQGSVFGRSAEGANFLLDGCSWRRAMALPNRDESSYLKLRAFFAPVLCGPAFWHIYFWCLCSCTALWGYGRSKRELSGSLCGACRPVTVDILCRRGAHCSAGTLLPALGDRVLVGSESGAHDKLAIVGIASS